MKKLVRTVFVIATLLLGLDLTSSTSLGQSILPRIRNVGVVPVIWKGEAGAMSPYARQRALIESGFSEIVRDAKRFQILNDTIVSNNWSSPDGRRSMVEEFELQALMSLTLAEQDDLLVLTVRLMSPQLTNYLVESDRILKSWLSKSSDQQLNTRLKELVFRLVNRYPVDVFVTSLQGPFITLSGGQTQKVYEGDELDFYEVSVRQTHPINGSWLTFDYKYLGRATVIDSKVHSSIAQLKSLQYEGAIQVNSAAKVSRIDSRRMFSEWRKRNEESAALEQKEPRVVAVKPDQYLDDGTPLTPPVASSEVPPTPEEKTPPIEQPEPEFTDIVEVPEKKPEVAEASADETEQAMTQEDVEEIPPSEVNQEEPADDGPGFGESMAKFFAENFSLIGGTFGVEAWNAGGTVSTNSAIAPWLLNRLEGIAQSRLSEDQMLRFQTHLAGGSTSNGSYFGFGLSADYVLRVFGSNADLPFLDNIYVGPSLKLETLQVSSEPFGGMDVGQIGVIAHIIGRHHKINEAQTMDIAGAIGLDFLAFGQTGIGGTDRAISGVFAIMAELSVMAKRSQGEWEWGGVFRYNRRTFTLEADSLTFDSFYVGAVLRLRF
ncbi:MAG: hypothetical protein HRU19_00385 [Pseudobacteriovorax sp.]|nr:hypothetical protein [Pseudobacteriovorax sp.]